MLGAGHPGGQHRFGPARPLGPVPGQGQPRLLAQRLQPLPRAQRPVGVRLVGEQLAVVGQGGREPGVPVLARVHRQRGAERLLVLGGVDLDGRGCPDVGQVRLEEGGRGLAGLAGLAEPGEPGERGPGHRQRLGDRPGGRARVEIGKELLAGEVPADSAARAHQDKLAEPPGARPRPRACGAAPGDDGIGRSSLTRTATPPLSRISARASRVAGTANRREHRGNSAFLLFRQNLKKGASEMYTGYQIYQAERPKSAREQREIDLGNARLAAAASRFARRCWPGLRVPGARPGGRRWDARPPAPRPASSRAWARAGPGAARGGVNESGALPDHLGRAPLSFELLREWVRASGCRRGGHVQDLSTGEPARG